jgi:hypothetical protein
MVVATIPLHAAQFPAVEPFRVVLGFGAGLFSSE